MPFKKLSHTGIQRLIDVHKTFIGRTDELDYFIHNILKPEYPAHNILSISGNGGIGKSTLLTHFIDEAHTADFQSYCLTAIVNERQSTPASTMERFAEQLHLEGDFKKALNRYKEILYKLQSEREDIRGAFLNKASDVAGAIVEGVPLAGKLLKEGTTIFADYLVSTYHSHQLFKDAEQLENPIGDLTEAFIKELNQLACSQASLDASGVKRRRRVLLFFDTFEHLAIEVAPWLLDHFLEADIESNVVLVVAGRDSIELSIPNSRKRWQDYLDKGIIHFMPLDSFTEDETRLYLAARDISNPDHVTAIWHLSRGLPLYLSLLTSNPRGKVDPTADVVANFLCWIPEQETIKRRLVLDAALFSKPFNQDDLAAFTYLEHDRPTFYRWLGSQPFIRSNPLDGRFSYHELAQELFSRYLLQRAPEEYQATRRALVDYYEQRIEKMQADRAEKVYEVAEWQELVLALTQQLFLLPDDTSYIKGIEQVLRAYKHTKQAGKIVRVLSTLSLEQIGNPANASVRHIAKQLLQYIEAPLGSQEFLMAANSLLEKVYYNVDKVYYKLPGPPPISGELMATVYYNRGITYRLLKQYREAIKDFYYVYKHDPKCISVYVDRGWAFLLDNRAQRAIEDFDRASLLNPTDAKIFGFRGLAYRWLEKYQLAIQDFNHAIELDPTYAWAFAQRGAVYSLLEDHQHAISDLDRAFKLNSKNDCAYVQRYEAHRLYKSYQRVITDIGYEFVLNPVPVYSMGGWGAGLERYHKEVQAASSLKDYQRVATSFDRAIELDPKLDWAYYGRGLSHLWKQDIGQARADFTRSWELDPENINNGWIAEWTRMCQERPDLETAERLQAIIMVAPGHYVAYNCRGVVSWLRGSFEQALAELECAISLKPEEWDAYFWKGIICVFLERDREAMTEIRKSLELGLPPALLAPLHWLKQDRPNFYNVHAELFLSGPRFTAM